MHWRPRVRRHSDFFYNEFWSGTGVVFRTVFRQKYHNKMKEILKVEETNSESQIVIQAAKHGNLVSNMPKCKFFSNLGFEIRSRRVAKIVFTLINTYNIHT